MLCPLLFHRQRNTLALAVHFRHTHHYVLMQLYDVVRILHIPVSELRDMHQSVLMHTDVDECSEVCDVRHDTRQKHTHLQVANLMHTRVELEHLNRSTRVASRSLQLSHDVGKRRHAYAIRHIVREPYRLLQVLVLYQLSHRTALTLSHTLHDVVALGMHGAVVERILGVGYAQEAGTLDEGCRSESRHLLQFGTRAERTVLLSVEYDILSRSGVQSADIGEQRLAVLRLTPTVFTHDSTTISSDFFSSVWSTSC